MASTQAGRGAVYQQMIKLLTGTKSTTYDDYPIVGFYWWDEYDDNSEGLNWGLVSVNDNPYDGRSATILGINGTHGKDRWAYRTGGERGNYGDFITAVKAANDWALEAMQKGVHAPKR